MKIRHGIYSIAAFSLGILLAAVVGYTTGTPQPNITEPQATVQTQTTASEVVTVDTLKKKCGCCTERRERIQKMIQQARERRQAKKPKITANAP